MVILKCRSREGAWIEISTRPCGHKYNKGRSREGAWIEIKANHHQKDQDFVAPVRERGLKSVCMTL